MKKPSKASKYIVLTILHVANTKFSTISTPTGSNLLSLTLFIYIEDGSISSA
jgi:hypothetical protein